MSKKYKIGEIIGIIIGVTVGAFAASYITQSVFGKSMDQDVNARNYEMNQNQYSQGMSQQQGVF